MRPTNCPFTSLIHCLALIGFDLLTQVERNPTSSMPTHPTQPMLAHCATNSLGFAGRGPANAQPHPGKKWRNTLVSSFDTPKNDGMSVTMAYHDTAERGRPIAKRFREYQEDDVRGLARVVQFVEEVAKAQHHDSQLSLALNVLRPRTASHEPVSAAPELTRRPSMAHRLPVGHRGPRSDDQRHLEEAADRGPAVRGRDRCRGTCVRS
jgi:hypothetical protein